MGVAVLFCRLIFGYLKVVEVQLEGGETDGRMPRRQGGSLRRRKMIIQQERAKAHENRKDLDILERGVRKGRQGPTEGDSYREQLRLQSFEGGMPGKGEDQRFSCPPYHS